MKLPNFRRIFKTDYQQEYQTLVEKLAVTINNGFEQLYNMSQRNITLSENIACSVRTIEVTVDSSGSPTGSGTASFSLDTTGQIKGIMAIKATNLTNSNVYPNACPFITYTQDSTNITITNIAGLPANNKFQMVVIAWA